MNIAETCRLFKFVTCCVVNTYIYQITSRLLLESTERHPVLYLTIINIGVFNRASDHIPTKQNDLPLGLAIFSSLYSDQVYDNRRYFLVSGVLGLTRLFRYTTNTEVLSEALLRHNVRTATRTSRD